VYSFTIRTISRQLSNGDEENVMVAAAKNLRLANQALAGRTLNLEILAGIARVDLLSLPATTTSFALIGLHSFFSSAADHHRVFHIPACLASLHTSR